MPETPTDWLAQLETLLKVTKTRSPVVDELVTKLIQAGDAPAREAVQRFEEWLASLPSAPQERGKESSPSQGEGQERTSFWSRQLKGLVETFSTQTGKNSLIGGVVTLLTVLGVNSVTTSPKDVHDVVHGRAQEQNEQFQKIQTQLDRIEKKVGGNSKN